MEEDIKRTSGYAKVNDKDLIAELSFKLGKYEEKVKEDEAVIEEMAQSINILPNAEFSSAEEVVKFFRNRVKGGEE